MPNPEKSTKTSWGRFAGRQAIRYWIQDQGWQLVLPLAFLILALFFYPRRGQFDLNFDEGFNLMKAQLVMHGFSLYSQIWSDQPPLFTYLLILALRLFGLKVGVGRLLVSFFSVLLLWSVSQILSRTWGKPHALLGVIMLFLLPVYAELSVAVMIGLPAISLATVALLALTIWHQQRWKGWLVLSAVALSGSVLIKLFTGFLAPIFVVGILLAGYQERNGKRSWRSVLVPAALWGAVFLAVLLAAGLVWLGPSGLGSLLGPHFIADSKQIYSQVQGIFPIEHHIRNALTELILAVVGVVFIVRARRWLSLYLVAWALAGYGLLTNYAPVWYHQQLLVTVPAGLVAAIAAGEAVRLLPGILRRRNWFSPAGLLGALALAGTLLVVGVRAPVILPQFDLSYPSESRALRPLSNEAQILGIMMKYAPQTNWVVSDIPIYVFRAGLISPPELSVISMKRMRSGDLSEQEILALIQQYKPEQVLIGRFQLPALDEYLAENYRAVRSHREMTLYIRRDL